MIVVDFDDFCEEENKLDLLYKLKEKIPNFKVTLFTIPGKSSNKFLENLKKNDWMQFGIHGEYHTYLECEKWDKNKINQVLDKYEPLGYYEKLFKAPYWRGNEEIYKVLDERGYIIAENKPIEYVKNKYLLYNYSVHGHISNVCDNGIEEKYDYYSSLNGDFKFITELFNEIK